MLKFGLLLILSIFSLISFSQSVEKKSIVVEQLKMTYRTFRLEGRQKHEPVIIFENGIGGGGFEQIYEFLPKNAVCFEYDRNGLGESAIDSSLVSDNQIVERLHTLLKVANIQPPYLLVGHSIGGPYIRLFAAKYAEEVSGLVFIDPTDYLLTKEEDRLVKKKSKSLTGYREIWIKNLTALAQDNSVPAGVRMEAKRTINSSTPSFFKEYLQLPKLKDIPIAVIIAYAKPIELYETAMNEKLKLGINILPWWKELDNFRIQHFTELIRENHDSRIILLPNYSHGIHYQDPELVGKTVAEIYSRVLKNSKN